MTISSNPARSLHSASVRARQRGSALVTGLVFLVVLTLLGLSASSGAIQQEIMARNIRDQNLALQSAEAALKAAESWLFLYRADAASGAKDLLPVASYPAKGRADILPQNFCDQASVCEKANSTWWSTNSIVIGTDLNTPDSFLPKDVVEQPRYIIELFAQHKVALSSDDSQVRYYRITARGVGLTPNSVRIVRSIYRF